jgi:hypothetical protein
MPRKSQLTFEERIKAAYLHSVLGVDQQALSVAFEVNSGRISEACQAIAYAAADPKGVKQLVEAHYGDKEEIRAIREAQNQRSTS